MRILTPSAMRLEVLVRFVKAIKALGSVERERANQAVWWPGLSRQTEDINKSEPLLQMCFSNVFFQRDPGSL